MSISATDPFWTALAAYDLGSPPALNTASGTAASTAAAAGSASAAGTTAASASGTAASAAAPAPAASGTSTSSGNAIADLLDGQSSGVAVAVHAAVTNSLLDAMF